MARPDRVRTPREKSQNGANTLNGAASRPASTLTAATTESTKMTAPQNAAPRMNATVTLAVSSDASMPTGTSAAPTSQKPT